MKEAERMIALEAEKNMMKSDLRIKREEIIKVQREKHEQVSDISKKHAEALTENARFEKIK